MCLSFYLFGWCLKIITQGGWEQTFYLGGSGGYDDVYEDINVSVVNFLLSKENILVSKANIFVGKASILSAGARI